MDLIGHIRTNFHKSQQRVASYFTDEKKRPAPITWAMKINLRQCMEEAAAEGYTGFMWFPCDPKTYKTYLPQIQAQVKSHLPGFDVMFANGMVVVLVNQDTLKRNDLYVSTETGPIIDWQYMPPSVEKHLE